MKTLLLAIDLQIDFCNPRGSLYVNGANEDVMNINKLINNNLGSIDRIIMSMDSHQPIHIAHQVYWKDKDGNHPELFSTVTKEDVETGRWVPQYNASITLDYLTKLEQNGDVCTIWPPHCIIGTEGWSIEPKVFEAIENWTIATGESYQFVNKGMHQSTEHYSIFKAAVEYKDVEATLFNEELVETVKNFDRILIVGEAADFCVANTLKDLLVHSPELAPRIYMLTDCMSYIVEGSETAQIIFNKAKNLGVKFCKSTDLN